MSLIALLMLVTLLTFPPNLFLLAGVLSVGFVAILLLYGPR